MFKNFPELAPKCQSISIFSCDIGHLQSGIVEPVVPGGGGRPYEAHEAVCGVTYPAQVAKKSFSQPL